MVVVEEEDDEVGRNVRAECDAAAIVGMEWNGIGFRGLMENNRRNG